MSKILDNSAVEAFSCITDGNLASEWEKWKKRFQYYVAAAGLSDNKQKRAVLLHLIGPAGQENFDTLFDIGYNYESAIASLDSYFMPKKNLIYELGFEEEMIRDHVVMSCVDFSLELLQTIELSDHQASKMESFQEHDDSINATKRLAIDKKDNSNDRNRDMKRFMCGKSGHLANNKICKARSVICNPCQKVGHFALECQFKSKIISAYEKKPEGIYCIDLSVSESDREFANNIIPQTEGKNLSKVNCEIPLA